MLRAMTANGMRPILDDRRFSFEEAPEAYRHLRAQAHVGKVVVTF